MSDENDQRKAFDKFIRFMQRHLFGLIAFIDDPNDDEHFPMASGIITESEGLPVLVTVAHFLEDVKRWKDGNRLSALFLLGHDESGACVPLQVNLDEIPASFCNMLDIGFLILDEPTLAEINKQGGALTRRDTLAMKPEEFASFYLIGHMSSRCKLETHTIATKQQGDKLISWKISRPSDFATAVSKLTFEKNGSDPGTYRFALVKGFDDYSGASGGPIIGYKDGAKIPDYCLFGIQSKQILSPTSEQKPTHVIATSAALAIHVIDGYIQEMRKKVEKERKKRSKRKKK